jgi:hypothetical protein
MRVPGLIGLARRVTTTPTIARLTDRSVRPWRSRSPHHQCRRHSGRLRSKVNSLSGGSAPSSFKGFATEPGNPPVCGGTFTADLGNSGRHPPSAVPSYMGVLVTSSMTKSGSTISGARSSIVVVSTTGSPSGRGVVAASFCP